MNSKGTLDPDELARLEDERDFLLDSLDDLDAELAAGDIDPIDHETLRDGYTTRAAEVMRAIDERRAAFAGIERSVSLGRRLATLAAIAALVAVAGVLLARGSGFRTPADSLTGDVRQSAAGLLSEADTLTREGRYDEAIERYDELLDFDPGSAEALTYRGWLAFQIDEVSDADNYLADAVAIDPTYPDARVFRALIARRAGQWDAAADELAVLDTLDLSPGIEAMLVNSDIRAEVMAVRIENQFGTGDPVDLNLLVDQLDDAQLDQVTFGAAIVEANGNPGLAIRVFTAVIDENPEHVPTLVNMGRRAATCDLNATAPDVAAQLLGLLDRAVTLAPDEPEPLMWRAAARSIQGDAAGSAADVETLRAMDDADDTTSFVDVIEQVQQAGCT